MPKPKPMTKSAMPKPAPKRKALLPGAFRVLATRLAPQDLINWGLTHIGTQRDGGELYIFRHPSWNDAQFAVVRRRAQALLIAQGGRTTLML